MKIVKIIEIIVILLLFYFNYSFCYESFPAEKPLIFSFITAIMSFIAVSFSFYSNEGKGCFTRIKSAILTFIFFHISVLIAYIERFGLYELSTFMEYVVKYIFCSLILQLVASSFFFIPMGLVNGFSTINLRKPKFTNKKEKTYKYCKNNGSDDKGNVVDGNEIIEYEDFEHVYDDENGNTESDSEQSVFSKAENNQGIRYNKHSDLDKESKNKDIKQIGFDKRPEKVETRSDKRKVEN